MYEEEDIDGLIDEELEEYAQSNDENGNKLLIRLN